MLLEHKFLENIDWSAAGCSELSTKHDLTRLHTSIELSFIIIGGGVWGRGHCDARLPPAHDGAAKRAGERELFLAWNPKGVRALCSCNDSEQGISCPYFGMAICPWKLHIVEVIDQTKSLLKLLACVAFHGTLATRKWLEIGNWLFSKC